jgi:uncharacterized protein (DUF885 family)
MRQGVVLPRPLVERLLSQLDPLAPAELEQSVFWKPVTAIPAAFPAEDRARLTAAYRVLIEERLNPAYRRLAKFLHEAIPGHHYQIALAQEVGTLPSFRRFGGYTAFSEG